MKRPSDEQRTSTSAQLDLIALTSTAVSSLQPADFADKGVRPDEGGGPELHRHHMAPTQGNSVDLLHHRIRIEGGDYETKRQIAYRIALCWNVCEGWPTEALDAGVLRDAWLATEQLVLKLRDEQLSPASVDALRALEHSLRQQDRVLDLRDGRLHDCPECLGRSASKPAGTY